MKDKFTVSVEVIACILEINSELSLMIEEGLTPDSMEALELINNRLETLVNDIREEIAA